jgi:SH3 domain-containing YSC84-like protein 1
MPGRKLSTVQPYAASENIRHEAAIGGAMNLRAPLITILCVATVAVCGCAAAPTTRQARQADVADAQSRVDRAVEVIDQMQSQPGAAALLRNAMGVLVVPDYAQAAFILGGRGGVGLLVAKHDGHWTDPAFFQVGGLSLGLQAGVDAGPVAYVLMTPRAVQEFENRSSKFSLGADAGLTIAKFSSSTNIVSTLPTADVIVWTGTAGVFGGVAFDATDVVTNSRLDEAYYHGLVSVRKILDGAVHNRLADRLQGALS